MATAIIGHCARLVATLPIECQIGSYAGKYSEQLKQLGRPGEHCEQNAQTSRKYGLFFLRLRA